MGFIVLRNLIQQSYGSPRSDSYKTVSLINPLRHQPSFIVYPDIILIYPFNTKFPMHVVLERFNCI